MSEQEEKTREEAVESTEYFMVSFTKDGTIRKVIGPNGKVEGEKLDSHNMIKVPIDKVDTVTILSSPKGSPCCIIQGGVRYCWC